MADNELRQDATQRGATSTASNRLPRIVIRIAATSLYMAAFTLSMIVYILHGASSISLGQLMGAINLGMWGLIAVVLSCDFDRCWGRTLIEHILTLMACACIGLAMYNCLANIVLNPSIPTLEQVAPPIAVIDTSPVSVFVVVIPIILFVLIQQRHAGARWWE
jgi:hypothetical protein